MSTAVHDGSVSTQASQIARGTVSDSNGYSFSCAGSWVATFYLLGGILLGTLLAVAMAVRRHVHTRQAMADRRQRDRRVGGGKSRNSISVYMNIFLTNKDEVVHNTVLEKVPHGVFGVVQKLASKVATKLVSNESVARKVGDIIAVAVPRKLETKKLKANGECIYVQGGLAVVRVDVIDIDLLGLIARKLPDKRINQVRCAYHCWNQCGASRGDEDEMPFHLLKKRAENAFHAEVWAQIESQVVSSLGGQIEAKLWNEAGVEAIVVAKAEHKQAKFFFDLLSSMNVSKSRLSVPGIRNNSSFRRRKLTPSMVSALPLLLRERGPRLPQTMMDPDQLFTAASKFLSRSKNAEKIYKRLRYRQREGEIESAITVCKLFSALHNRANNISSGRVEVSQQLADRSLSPVLRNVKNLSSSEAKKQYVVMLGDLMPEWTRSLACKDPNNAGSRRQMELTNLSKHIESNKVTNSDGVKSSVESKERRTCEKPNLSKKEPRKDELYAQLSHPSPLSIFLQPLLFPDVPPLPVGRLHCCIVSAHGVRMGSHSLSLRPVGPEFAFSTGIPPEPLIPQEILVALAVNCGPAAASAKRALIQHWKGQQEQADQGLLRQELRLQLYRSGPKDLSKLTYENQKAYVHGFDEASDMGSKSVSVQTVQGVAKSNGDIYPENAESTFMLPVQSTSPMSCLRVVLNNRSGFSDKGHDTMCEAAVDLSQIFQSRHGLPNVWIDVYINLLKPFRALTAVKPKFDLGDQPVHPDAAAQNKRGSIFSSMRSGKTQPSRKPESSSGVLHMRLKFESMASTLGNNLANQAAIGRKRENERSVQEQLVTERLAEKANAMEAKQERRVEEERQRLQNKRASLFGVLGSAVRTITFKGFGSAAKVISAVEQGAEEMILGTSLIRSRKYSPADSFLQPVLENVEKWLQWFEYVWEANRNYFNNQASPDDSTILLTIYFGAAAASGSMNATVLQNFQQLQFNYEWWKTCYIIERVLSPLICLGKFCLSYRVLLAVTFGFCFWYPIEPFLLLHRSLASEMSAISQYFGVPALYHKLESFSIFIFLRQIVFSNTYTFFSSCAWILIVRVVYIRLVTGWKRENTATSSNYEFRDLYTQDPGLTREQIGHMRQRQNGIRSWSQLAKQGLSRAQRELEAYTLSKLQKRGELNVVLADLDNADFVHSLKSILLFASDDKDDQMNRLRMKQFVFHTRGMLLVLRSIGTYILYVPKLLRSSWNGDTGATSRVLISCWVGLTVCIYFGFWGIQTSIICLGVYWIIRKTATAQAVENLVQFFVQLSTHWKS